jgi:hypothetical protein
MMAAVDDAEHWRAARQLRRDRPRWVVIWLADAGRYRAYPLFRTRGESVVTAATPPEAADQMAAIEKSARPSGQRSVSP